MQTHQKKKKLIATTRSRVQKERAHALLFSQRVRRGSQERRLSLPSLLQIYLSNAAPVCDRSHGSERPLCPTIVSAKRDKVLGCHNGNNSGNVSNLFLATCFQNSYSQSFKLIGILLMCRRKSSKKLKDFLWDSRLSSYKIEPGG